MMKTKMNRMETISLKDSFLRLKKKKQKVRVQL